MRIIAVTAAAGGGRGVTRRRQQDPESVMVKVSEVVREGSGLLDEQVDRFGATVVHAVVVR
jgi:hypothetical protein